MSFTNPMTLSKEKSNGLLSLLAAGDSDLAEDARQGSQSEAMTLSWLLAAIANTLASPSSLESVRGLGEKDVVPFLTELVKASQATVLACEGVQSVLPSTIPNTLVEQLSGAAQSLKAKIGETQSEVSQLEECIREVVDDNKVAEDQLAQRMKEVDLLFEKNSELKSLLDIYANVNAYVARSLPGRLHNLTTKLNRIEQELQDVDAGLRSAIEEHQKTGLLLPREA